MNRRNFLQVVSAAFVAVGLPAVIDADSNPLFRGHPIKWHGFEFKRITALFDFANFTGVCIETHANGMRRRMAARFTTKDWQDMNRIQQESVWLQLEMSLAERIENERT